MARIQPELQAADHRRAHHRWIPFLVRLFESGPLPRADRALPLGVEGLSQQAVEAAAAILREGALKTLIRYGGWRAVPRPAGPRRRLWQDPRACAALSFSEESLDLALLAFQLARPELPASSEERRALGRRQIGRALRSLKLTKSGDLLVHHQVFERLRGEGLLEDMEPLFAANPLNALLLGAEGLGGDSLVDALSKLEGPLGAWLPWIGHEVLRRWLRSDERRWSSLADFQELNERQSFLLQYWAELGSAERPGLLRPLAELYAAWMAASWRPRHWLESIARWTQGRPIYERQALTRRWLELYDAAEVVAAAGDELMALHPLDRESDQAFFLERLASLGFADRRRDIAALRAEADPVIG